jgi:hypothetical protein
MIAILVQYQGLVKQNSYCLTSNMEVACNPGQKGNVADSAYFGICFIPNLRHCICVIFIDFDLFKDAFRSADFITWNDRVCSK